MKPEFHKLPPQGRRWLKFDDIFLHMSGVDIEDDEAARLIDDLANRPTNFGDDSWFGGGSDG